MMAICIILLSIFCEWAWDEYKFREQERLSEMRQMLEIENQKLKEEKRARDRIDQRLECRQCRFDADDPKN